MEKVDKSLSCLKRVKNCLERVKLLIRELNYQSIHSRGKVIPLNRWNQVPLLLKKSITSFGAVKKSKFIILLIFVPISRVVVTL